MPLATFDREKTAAAGAEPLIGVDEAGRGPLAGPVVACAAWVPPASYALLSEINDSKKLTARRRTALFGRMLDCGVRFGFGFADPARIDSLNILQATFLAMSDAVGRLLPRVPGSPEKALVLVDGPHKVRGLELRQLPVVDGDALSLSVACASVFAKVIRDNWMDRLDAAYPGYGFRGHKGYGTPAHLEALRAKGPCAAHRLSFAPVRACRLPEGA